MHVIQRHKISEDKPKPLLYLRAPQTKAHPLQALGQGGWDVDVTTHLEEAVALMEQRDYSVGILHWNAQMLDSNAIRRCAADLLNANSRTNWVGLLSGAARLPSSLGSVISNYFYGFHMVPVDPNRLLTTLGQASEMADLEDGNARNDHVAYPEHDLVGSCRSMKAVLRQIGKVAAIDFNVLIRGESGTGKELTAQAIHQLSQRASGPFVAVNCGALPSGLIQTELFGHEKGSFTGADRQRVGRIEAAQNGTLFLDEIGDLPLDLQVNLLRFIQEKRIDRIGGSQEIPVDVRIVAATNVDLERAVKEGRFREDLYYRLDVLNVDLPPLRDRGNDIALLAEHFLEKFSKQVNPRLKGFSDRAIDVIVAHTWPGNVREMANRIQRAVVMCEGRLLTPRDLGLDQEGLSNPHLETLAQARAAAEKRTIHKTLRTVNNNVSKAARLLEVSRVTLYRLMELHAIDWQNGNDI